MVVSSDRGSLPFVGDYQKFLEGAAKFGRAVDDQTSCFERKIVDSFLDKLRAGVDVPNYPQFRDMNQMFLDMIEGIGRIDSGYVETSDLSVENGKGIIPETSVLETCSAEIGQRFGPFQLRVCVTGPYTLSSFFAYKDKNTFTRLGQILTEIIGNNIFNNKHASVRLIAVDEPVFGFVDDPLLDRGSETRENLLKAWESMMQKAVSKGAQTSLHLHNTSNELFWEIKSLEIVESHALDPLYQNDRTKELLESHDKFLNASISVTNFDELIRTKIIATANQKPNEQVINEKIAETWKKLSKKQLDPRIFVENVEVMKERLVKIVNRFGHNRVSYAGTECGLKSFPTYDTALECLRRMSLAAKSVAK